MKPACAIIFLYVFIFGAHNKARAVGNTWKVHTKSFTSEQAKDWSCSYNVKWLADASVDCANIEKKENKGDSWVLRSFEVEAERKTWRCKSFMDCSCYQRLKYKYKCHQKRSTESNTPMMKCNGVTTKTTRATVIDSSLGLRQLQSHDMDCDNKFITGFQLVYDASTNEFYYKYHCCNNKANVWSINQATCVWHVSDSKIASDRPGMVRMDGMTVECKKISGYERALTNIQLKIDGQKWFYYYKCCVYHQDD